jgi:predicted AlkP superfamily pyrophosphatase or phosphodiesterase
MPAGPHLLVLDVAALGWDLVQTGLHDRRDDFAFRPMETVFPALTCTAQASFRTEALPCFHGLLANGFYDRTLARAFFWEQSSALVYGRRLWADWRARGRSVGLMFWQQSLGEEVDRLLTPKPVHKHHGGMIQDCYSQPPDLYQELVRKTGRSFDLMRYWGPMASARSSEWIADAVLEEMHRPKSSPELLMAYLPHLDYDLQRKGPGSVQATQALKKTLALLDRIRTEAVAMGYEVVIFGDYAIAPVTRPPVHLNVQLREAGLFHVRQVAGRTYPDFATSEAFALADHEIALVYVRKPANLLRVREAIEKTGQVAEVLDMEGQRRMGADLAPTGPDFIVLAEEGSWCAYPWWTEEGEAPDFADHVDIHNKPGYDPCELFWGWPPGRVSRNPARVCGTHGRAGPGRRVAWSSTIPFDPEPANLVELAGCVGKWLSSNFHP